MARTRKSEKVVAPVSEGEPEGPPQGDVSDAGAVNEHFVRPDFAGVAEIGGVTVPDLGGALTSQIVTVTAPDGAVLELSKVTTSSAERRVLTARFLAEHA